MSSNSSGTKASMLEIITCFCCSSHSELFFKCLMRPLKRDTISGVNTWLCTSSSADCGTSLVVKRRCLVTVPWPDDGGGELLAHEPRTERPVVSLEDCETQLCSL